MESHINTFDKGMNKDYNILFQPEGTYRNCINCQLVSQDGNNYVIKDCLGNVKLFNINIPFATFVAGAPPTVTYQAAPMPIGFISFPDKLIVFSTNDETETGGYGEIGMIQYDTYGEGIQPINNASGNLNTYKGYVPLYHHVSLKFTKQRQIEGFAYAENDVEQRVYWTDDLNEPRVFDVGNPIFTTIIPTGSLLVGSQYMVLEGAITHNGVLYSPDTTFGNVFTAVNANYTDESSSFVNAKVIKYYPYQLLNFTPSRSLGNIRFDQYGSGTLYAGAKMYFYRLVNGTDGINTSWSYGSSPIHVGTTNSIAAVPANSYEDFVGAGTQTVLQVTGYSVKILIDNIDTNFQNIQVAVAEYDQLLNVPRLISIIADEVISNVTITTPTGYTGTTVRIEHTGSANLGTLTTDDITLFPASILSCKTMATNKNYILIGNITERSELTFSNTGVTIGSINYAMPSHQDNDLCANVFLYNQVAPSTIANPPLVDGIAPGTQWLVVSGGQVLYNAVVYPVGSVFVGVVGVFNWAVSSGVPVVRPCTSKNKYTTNTAALRPDAIQIKGNGNVGFWDYKEPAVAHHVKGYWNGDTYRFGILFYDLKGNPFYTRWLGDYTTPRQDTKFIMDIKAYQAAAPTDMAFLNQTGITISGITIPAADIDKISGFSIVRAERDKRIITQGLLTQCTSSVAPPATPAVINPTPSAQQGFSPWFNGGDGNYSYFSYLSPDSLVSFPMDNLTINNYIEEACWLEPKKYQAAPDVYMKSVVNNFQTETKYFTAKPNDGSTDQRRNKVTAIDTIDEDVLVTDFGGTGYNFLNSFLNPVGGPLTNTTCISGVPLTTQSLAASVATGGRKIILRVEGFLFDYGSLVVDYDDSTLADVYKILVNYVRDNPTPYGGTSEAALAATNYIQCGHFQPINATVKSETIVGSDYVFNDVHVWGGDAYTCLVDYGYALYNSGIIGGGYVQGYSWGIKFPCQSNVNYDLRRGRKIANNQMHSLPNGVAYLEAGTTRLEGFAYNQAYSSDGMNFAYPALPVNFIDSGIFRFRIRFAGQKFPGELINSFRNFAINDYKDTDGQGGEINNIRTKDGKSIVWQNQIISTVPILERQLLGAGSGQDTTIGTGGVVDRFDPVNDYFGNQHQHGLTETEYGFAWFDMRRKAFVVLDNGIMEVSKIDGLKSFFDEIIVDTVGSTVINPRPLNSTTYLETSDRPLVGVGITGVYDPKLKMTYITFKWKQYPSSIDQAINKNFTIGYYHLGKCFVGFYDWFPAISWNHNQTVFSANDPKSKTKYYGAGMSSTAFVQGETVKIGSSEYVAIQDVTVASYPGTGGASGTNPVTGTNNWTLINNTNELWVLNQPTSTSLDPAPDYQYNKFFGLVVNNELEIVVNPKTANAFSALNIEQKGNNVNYTDIYTDADGVTAADNAIAASNRYYRYIWDKICSNLPLSLISGRITNSYLKIRMVKKNWSTNPTTLTGSVKILQYIKTYFEQKR